MLFYIQVDKETKRVKGYSSSSCESDIILEIEIDDNNTEYEELLVNPYIFVFNESSNTFTKDVAYQESLIKSMKNRLSVDDKIEYLTKQLAAEKLAAMKKDSTINMLMKQQAQNKLEIMKLKGSN
ncbi:hypothetical protein ACFO6R_12765 [Eubacterium multiforme]|uniref:Uncharacterized protein n=1 Tax=Eubacterium multiforme TaxID=83339 RepID=A0ABT9UW69_9FIRM|nr:hypothetical protein [Eubacterium multiforme]MDQ0150559.1 hypothetical protein [Eubacterium multiforme]